MFPLFLPSFCHSLSPSSHFSPSTTQIHSPYSQYTHLWEKLEWNLCLSTFNVLRFPTPFSLSCWFKRDEKIWNTHTTHMSTHKYTYRKHESHPLFCQVKSWDVLYVRRMGGSNYFQSHFHRWLDFGSWDITRDQIHHKINLYWGVSDLRWLLHLPF